MRKPNNINKKDRDFKFRKSWKERRSGKLYNKFNKEKIRELSYTKILKLVLIEEDYHKMGRSHCFNKNKDNFRENDNN